MAEMTLSTKEFLFAAANLGAKNFFGISDPFYGMTAEEIRANAKRFSFPLKRKDTQRSALRGILRSNLRR